MEQVVGIIKGCEIRLTTEIEPAFSEIVEFTAEADIDRDGQPSPPNSGPYYDPDFQPDTFLHGPDGRPLSAYQVPYIVVPPLICQRTRGLVMGALCRVENITNGMSCDSVVGDIGPHDKLGEISPKCAMEVGVNPNPEHGGTHAHIIHYTIYVGKPAVINGVPYQLKHF